MKLLRFWMLVLACAILFGILSWFVLLSPAERSLVRHPWLMKATLSRS